MSRPLSLTPLQLRLRSEIESRRAAMLDDLRTLVNTPTGRAPHPRALEGLEATRRFFEDRLRRLGCSIQRLPGQPRPGWLDGPDHFRRPAASAAPNAPAPPAPPAPPEPILVARHEPRGPGRLDGGVLLSGHLDTVHDPALPPDAPFARLSIAPDGRTATGPGVVDMKGGLVIALHALEALAHLGALPPFVMVLNSDEETGSFGSDAALRSLAAQAAAAGASMALALEPAAGEGASGLVTARGGSGQFLLTARGTSAHVGRAFASGRSATDALARAIIAAHTLTDLPTGRIVNISTLYCDQPANQVSDFAAAWGNLRYPDAAAGDALARALAALPGAPPSPGATVEADVRLIRPAKPATAATLALSQRIAALAARLGHDPVTFTTTAGVCDGNNLQAGVTDGPAESGGAGVRGELPVLDTLGVRGGGLHTPGEWIDLSTLTQRATLLAALISDPEPKP